MNASRSLKRKQEYVFVVYLLQRFSVEDRNDSFGFYGFIWGIFDFRRKIETCVPALKMAKMSNRTHARPMRHALCAGSLDWASGSSPCAFVTTAPAREAATVADFQDIGALTSLFALADCLEPRGPTGPLSATTRIHHGEVSRTFAKCGGTHDV